MEVSKAIAVRRDDTGLLVIPSTSDIVSDNYALYLMAQLKEYPDAWIAVVSEVLSRPTPIEWIEKREGPGKKMFAYVEGTYAKVTRQAISRLGIASDFEIVQTDVNSAEVNCLGKLTFKYKGVSSSSMQWGRADAHSGVPIGNTKKAATTDALKKCMSEFGWALDVYSMEPEAVVLPDPAELKAEAVKGLYNIGARVGMIKDEVDKFVSEQTGGKKAEDLEPKDLTAMKRKLERIAKEKEGA